MKSAKRKLQLDSSNNKDIIRKKLGWNDWYFMLGSEIYFMIPRRIPNNSRNKSWRTHEEAGNSS